MDTKLEIINKGREIESTNFYELIIKSSEFGSPLNWIMSVHQHTIRILLPPWKESWHIVDYLLPNCEPKGYVQLGSDPQKVFVYYTKDGDYLLFDFMDIQGENGVDQLFEVAVGTGEIECLFYTLKNDQLMMVKTLKAKIEELNRDADWYD